MLVSLFTQKTPLLRGSCLNPLGGGYFNNTIFRSRQTPQPVSGRGIFLNDKRNHKYLIVVYFEFVFISL